VVEGLGPWEWEDGSRGVVALTGDGEEGDMVHAVFGFLVLWVGGVGVKGQEVQRRKKKEACHDEAEVMGSEMGGGG